MEVDAAIQDERAVNLISTQVESRPSTAMTAEERLLMESDGETKEQRWNPKMQGFAHNNARTGFLEGEMALPRFDAYTIEFTIKRNPMASDLGDPTDRCTVKLGPNLRNLQEVAVAKNIVDEYAGRAQRGKLQVVLQFSLDTVVCIVGGRGRVREFSEGPSHSARSDFRVEGALNHHKREDTHRLRALRVHARHEHRHVGLALRVHVLHGRSVVTLRRRAGGLRAARYSCLWRPPMARTESFPRTSNKLRLEMNSGSMKYANWLAELIKAESVPPVPSDPDQAALIAAKAAKFGQAPPGFWDSDSLHATPQRHHIGHLPTVVER